MVSIIHKPVTKPLSDKNNGTERDVTKTGNGERGVGSGEWGVGSGERGVGNGERKSGNIHTYIHTLFVM